MQRLIHAASLLLLFSLAACGGGGGGDGDGGGNGGNSTTTTLRNTTTTSVFRPTTTTVGGPGTTVPTTTTLGEPGACPSNNRVRCTATFRVTNNVTLGGLQFTVDYADVNGCFQGQGDNVLCSTPANAIATFNDEDGEQRLRAALASVAGVDAPADVAECTFIAAGSPPDPNDFAIDVTESVTPDLTPRVANVDITLDCDGGGGTTTTTTTGGGGTTTTGGPTTSTTVEERDTEFDVVLRLDEAVNVGSLQLTVDYTQAPGDFRGSGASEDEGGSLECSSLVPGALVSFNDDDEGSLTAGFISLDGFTGPTDLATCVFDRFGFGTVVRSDFTVTVDSATDPEVDPIEPPPDVVISRIIPR